MGFVVFDILMRCLLVVLVVGGFKLSTIRRCFRFFKMADQVATSVMSSTLCEANSSRYPAPPSSTSPELQSILSAHYSRGGHWWNIDVDSILETIEQNNSKLSGQENQNKTAQEERADEDFNEVDSISNTSDHEERETGKECRKKKKSKAKSKKKSKRGHGKRNKTKEKQEDNQQNESTVRAPLASLGSGNVSTPALRGSTPQTETTGSTKMAGRRGESRPSQTNEARAEDNGYWYWQQFSTSASQRDSGEATSNQNHTCVKCGLKGSNLMLCKRCKLARYCSKTCERKNAGRHKATCLRMFAFNTAREAAQPFLTHWESVVRGRVKNPPVSYYMGSIPDSTRYKVLPFHPPVLLEIQEAGLNNSLEWVVKVRDVGNNTTTVVIDTIEPDPLLVHLMCSVLKETLISGHFILILNAHWQVGSTPENCVIPLQRGRFKTVPGVDLNKFIS